MRLVIARCSVDYVGRLEAHLPSAVRLLMVKADGSVQVHADGGAFKPLNWMNPPVHLVEQPDRWIVRSPKGETLTILLEEILADHRHEMGPDPGLRKDGVEAHLQELLAANPDALEPEILKAALLAGAEHRAGWANNAPQSGTSRGLATKPLDVLYGADELDINNAHAGRRDHSRR